MQLITAKGVLTVFDIKLSVISWRRCSNVDKRTKDQWLPDGNGHPGEALRQALWDSCALASVPEYQ